MTGRAPGPRAGPAPILWLEWREGALFPVAEVEGRRLHDGWLDHVLRGLERDAKRT